MTFRLLDSFPNVMLFLTILGVLWGCQPQPVEIDCTPPGAGTNIQAGTIVNGVQLLSDDFELEELIPPCQTKSAPFDSAVLPDGSIVMEGCDNSLVQVGLDGTITQTSYPSSGVNFESDVSGRMWYYNWVSGILDYWEPGMTEVVTAASLKPVYTDGSLAVASDGSAVYVAWWKRDYDLGTDQSVLYRYTATAGIEAVWEGNGSVSLNAVEVTADGTVYVARTDGIFRMDTGVQMEKVSSIGGVLSDAMCSDVSGNLYFTASGIVSGLYCLTPDGDLTMITSITLEDNLFYGLSWHAATGQVIGVRKESGELVAVAADGTLSVLNAPSGFTTPIAIAEHPCGAIFANGDEAGLLMVDRDAIVSRFSEGLISYQPPAADFVFDDTGNIYYSEAAPGFTNRIVRVDTAGKVSQVTAQVDEPAGLDLDPQGRLCIADYGAGKILRLLDNGTLEIVAENIPYPVGLKVDDNGTFWVGAAEQGAMGDPNALDEVYSKRILSFSPGETLREIVSFAEGSSITFFDVDISGTLYLPINRSLYKCVPKGTLAEIAVGFSDLRGAAVASDGRVYLTDYETGALYRLTPLPSAN